MSESRFTGKQVLGIVIAAIAVLGLGLTIGGLVGYRWGKADGSPQTIVQAPAPNGSGDQAPRSFEMPQPFNQVPNGPSDQLPPGFELPQPFNQVPSIDTDQPYLGVEFEMLTPEIAARENMTGTTGALVRTVIPNGPAARAGLKVNDVITAIDGASVDDQHPLRDRILEYKIGDQVTLTIVTGTPNGPLNSREVKVTLARLSEQQSFHYQFPPDFNPFGQPAPRPAQPAVPADAPYLGVEFEMITPKIAARENISGTSGAIIRSVVADSPAEQAGLKRGDIITAVDGTPIDTQHTLRDLVVAHKIGDVLTLTVVSLSDPAQSREVKVTLAPRPADNDLQIPGNVPGVPSPNTPSG
jgi:membrane-associated protease RseP (regulator of RpoE activity)